MIFKARSTWVRLLPFSKQRNHRIKFIDDAWPNYLKLPESTVCNASRVLFQWRKWLFAHQPHAKCITLRSCHLPSKMHYVRLSLHVFSPTGEQPRPSMISYCCLSQMWHNIHECMSDFFSWNGAFRQLSVILIPLRIELSKSCEVVSGSTLNELTYYSQNGRSI